MQTPFALPWGGQFNGTLSLIEIKKIKNKRVIGVGEFNAKKIVKLTEIFHCNQRSQLIVEWENKHMRRISVSGERKMLTYTDRKTKVPSCGYG